MKKVTPVSIILLFLISLSAFADYSGGSGTEADPWQISCPNDLLYLASHPSDYNSCFILTADINLAGYNFKTAVIAPHISFLDLGFDGTFFTGKFNGNDFVIHNLTIDANGTRNSCLGLFGQTGPGCEIRHLGIVDVNIAGGNNSYEIGGLVGCNYSGTISNCYVEGLVTGLDYVRGLGGLAGSNYGTINNCYATGAVEVGDLSGYLGGLVGYNHGTINNCYATSTITGGYYSRDLGGLVGYNEYGTINNCYAAGTVTGERGSWCLGGLLGSNYEGEVNNCYATGTITGGYYSRDLGGLVGYNQLGKVSNCYSTGKVIAGPSSRYLGGLAGWCNVPVSNCFWDKQASGMRRGVGGGYQVSSIFGKTTAEMQTQSTFTDYGWDFVGETANGTEDIWFVREGREYPKFYWQNNRPVANAGHDQTVYAWIDNFADVNLDSSGSYDVDGDQITYQWSWSIDANTFEANGVNPTIELPVGEHTVSLVVSDFLDNSEPNDVNVIVIEPIKSHLLILPRAINLKSKMPRITAMMMLPEGITKEQVDSNYRLMLYVGMSEQGDGIKAFYQRIYQFKNHGVVRTAILAFFEKSDLSSWLPARRSLELQAVGRLATGQYFYGRDKIMVINPKPPIWKVR